MDAFPLELAMPSAVRGSMRAVGHGSSCPTFLALHLAGIPATRFHDNQPLDSPLQPLRFTSPHPWRDVLLADPAARPVVGEGRTAGYHHGLTFAKATASPTSSGTDVS
jgi:hypothetical protein